MVQYIWRLPRNILIGMIDLYQMTLSPDHGPLRHMHPYGFCRHEPTCSEYGKRVLCEYGVIVGTVLIAGRVLSCNPFTPPSERKFKKMLQLEDSDTDT